MAVSSTRGFLSIPLWTSLTCCLSSLSPVPSLVLPRPTVRLTASLLLPLRRWVYLKPVFTNQVKRALTDVRVRIEDSAWSGDGTPDLAKGAGGKYRYLQFNRDVKNNKKYEAAALLRRAGGPASINDAPKFNVITSDINAGRGGDYLYVVFKSRQVFEIEKIKT